MVISATRTTARPETTAGINQTRILAIPTTPSPILVAQLATIAPTVLGGTIATTEVEIIAI